MSPSPEKEEAAGKGHFSIPGTVRCPSQDAHGNFQCEFAEGHNGYHVCVTPRRTIKWNAAGVIEDPFVEQVEDRWPVLTVLKHRHSDEPGEPITWDLIDEKEAPEFRDPAESDFAVEAYHPESAPNVLSPDEARLLLKVNDGELESGAEFDAAGELCNRLEAWAEREGTK
jgi:hypothetical protein